MACPNCGKEHKRSVNGPCPACAKRVYYQTAKGKEAVKRANKKWVEKYPEKRFAAVVRYRNRTGYYIPSEVHSLRAAVKGLERAVAGAEDVAAVHVAGKRRRLKSLKRDDRYGAGSHVLRSGQGGIASGEQRDNAGKVRKDHA